MNVKQRDLVLLPVPFSNQAQAKVRPALVVSNDTLNAASDDVVLIPLTSVIKDVPYSVVITQDDLAQGKLIVASRARADKVFTADKSLITMRIGAVKNELFVRVKGEMVKVFG